MATTSNTGTHKELDMKLEQIKAQKKHLLTEQKAEERKQGH